MKNAEWTTHDKTSSFPVSMTTIKETTIFNFHLPKRFRPVVSPPKETQTHHKQRSRINAQQHITWPHPRVKRVADDK
jgi:hypothetical protein